MSDDSKKVEKRLVELGEGLSSPPSSVDELYELLDQIDGLLSSVEQSPSQTMLTALRPLMTALAAKDFLRHSDLDVKAVVASCISEITRITAPDAPYDDDDMKEIFQMIVETFEGLDKMDSRSFQKRVSILETVAKIRSCVVMLDLECDALILEMFHTFLKTIRIYHSKNVFSCMEIIMTLVIEESEDISTELLSILLDTLRNDKKDALSIAQRLAEKVMSNCASKIKSCLLSLVRSKDAPLSEYHKVVASICQENDALDRNGTNTSCEVVADVSKFSERTSSDEPPQVSAKLEHEAACPEKVGTATDTLPVVAVNNGTIHMGNGDSINQPSSPKPKPEHSFCNGQSENVVSDHADSDNLESIAVETDYITDTKKEKGQKTNSSTQLTDTTGHSCVESHKGALEGTSSRDCLTKEADSLDVYDASTKEIKPAVSSEPEEKNELQHLSRSDYPTAVTLPSRSGSPRNSAWPRKGRPPGSMANVKCGDVDAKADLLASRSVQKDPSVVNHTHDEMMTLKVDECEREPRDADEVKVPVSLPSDSAVKPRKGRPPGSKANAKRGDVDAVADAPASRSVQKDPSVENHTHDEMMTSKVESEREPEDVDDVKTAASLPSDSAVKSRKGRPPGSKANAKRGVVAVADARASRSVQKGPSVENHTRDEMLTSKADESEKEPEDADNVEMPASLPSDSAVKSRRASKKGRLKKKAVVQESSGRKKSNTKQKKEEGAIGKDVDGEPNLKGLSSSARSASRVQSGDKAHVNDSVVPKPRRKHSMEAEDISGMPDRKKEVDECVVGSKIKVWWPDDEMFYDGVIDSYDPDTKKHTIVYADGDVELLLLKDEHWKYVDGDTQKEGGKRKAEGNASQTPQTKKPKASPNTMPEQAKLHEKSKSGTEASDKGSLRPRGRPKKGTSDLGKLSYYDSPETSKKSKGKSASDAKVKTPRSDGKLKDVAETESEVKTPRTSSKREGPGNKSKDLTSKISEKSKDEPTNSGKKSKNETPKAITKLKVYSSKGRGKSREDTATKDSTPRTASRSKADEVANNRTPKTGGDSKASSVSSKGKTKVEENENEAPVSDGKATTGGKKRKRMNLK